MAMRRENEKGTWGKEHIWGILGIIVVIGATVAGALGQLVSLISCSLAIVGAMLILNQLIHDKLDKTHREVEKLRLAVDAILDEEELKGLFGKMRKQGGKVKAIWCFDWKEMSSYLKREFADVRRNSNLSMHRLINPQVKDYEGCIKLMEEFVKDNEEIRGRYTWEETDITEFESYVREYTRGHIDHSEAVLILRPPKGSPIPQLGFYTSTERSEEQRTVVNRIVGWFESLRGDRK